MSKKSPKKIYNETLEANKTANRWKLYDKYKTVNERTNEEKKNNKLTYWQIDNHKFKSKMYSV